MREPHPLRGVAVGGVARARRHDVRLGSYADAEPIVAQADQALRIGRHLVRQLHLLRGFRRDEPGARDRCGQGLPGEAVVGVAGVALGDGGVALVAQSSPQIDFPRQAQHAAIERGDEVGDGVRPPAPQDADRGLQLRGGQIDLRVGLLDARSRHRKIRIVRQGLCDQRVELRVIEGR
ncbi:hypothetical protein D3C87_1391970 [compost metagenome]